MMELSANDDYDYLHRMINQMPSKPPMASISKYAASKRILPSNTPFPGLWRNDKTPYLVEIMDNMSPHSPVEYQAVMKGCQLGFTAAFENIIAYFMDECPTEILYISATGDLLETWGTKRLEPLIDSCGIRPKLTAQQTNVKSRRTGDKILYKGFVGGSLRMTSAQSAAGLRSDSIRVLLRDEIDGCPEKLKTGEGSWLAVSKGRTSAFGDRKKIMDISTPVTLDDSVINKQYQLGDKRKYLVPCPICGKAQELVFGGENSNHGLKADTKAGRLITTYYLCDYCHDAIFNYQKTDMLAAGKWVPSKKANVPNHRSYQMGSQYSPVGMYSWDQMYLDYMEADDEPDGMRTFTTIYQGLPYKETGTRPKLENVLTLRGGYKKGTVPDGALFLTAFIDVQTGSQTDLKNPARLEMEVMATGERYRTWSIDYRRFEGSVLDPHDGAWLDLEKFAGDGGLTYKSESGLEFDVRLVLIDSGDGNVTDTVYEFAETWGQTLPSKGFADLKRRAGEKKDRGDEVGPENALRYRIRKLNAGQEIVQISTNFYKRQVYRNLAKVRQNVGDQLPGFCDFPIQYDKNYFQMLIAEELRTDGSFHCPSGRRNEALDCRVGNLCAAHIVVDKVLEKIKLWAKQNGASIVDIESLNHKHAIDELKRQVANRK